MNRVKKIDIDLNTFKIALQFQYSKDPLILHFDTPSRKFYLSLIALIVYEMKQQDHPGFVYIRKHEKQLKFLDDALASSNASGTIDGMWEKIRKAWHYSLPNLEEASNFKIEGRDQVTPYEKGRKYRYECTEEECDIWASLFGIDEISNKWRFKFAANSVSLDVGDVHVLFNNLEGADAWDGFLGNLKEASITESAEQIDQIHSHEKDRIIEAIKNKKPFFFISIATALIIVTISSVAIMNRHFRPAKPVNELSSLSEPSIAVLPFVNLSKDPQYEYFADGITENIIAALSKVPHMFVISRTSSFTYKNKQTIIKAVSEELGVRYILEGSVQVSDEKLRVAAQLIDATNGFHIWSERYDRQLEDIFPLQDEITMRVITELQVELTDGEQVRIWTMGTRNLEAQLAFIQGTYHYFEMNPDDLLHAKNKFERAIRLDPEYAEAYGFLAFVHWLSLRAGRVKDKDKTEKQIFINAQKAVELDEFSVTGRLGLCGYYLTQKEFDKAIEHSKLAVGISPNNSMAVRVHGGALMMSGDPEKAIPFYKRAIRLDPKAPSMAYALTGAAYRHLKKYTEAIPHLEKSFNHTPKNIMTLMNLAACYVAVGRTTEANNMARRVMELKPNMNVETFIRRTEHRNEEEKRIWSEQLVKAGIPLKPPKE